MASYDTSRIRRFTAAVLFILALSTLFAQQLVSADPTDQETAKEVVKIVPRLHVNKREVNDELSSQLFDRFLKDLDPQKSYFIAQDINEFEPYRTRLDDDLKAGKLDFCYSTFNRFKQRVGEQTELANYWINQPHDFTIEEFIQTDGKKQTWAANAEELNDRWRRRIKNDLLQLKLDDLSEEEAKKRLTTRYRNLKLIVDQYKPAEELEIFLTAFANCFDPHSTYMSPQTSEDFSISMKLSLDGIGALLGAEDGYTVVKQIIPGGAAADDGRLKVGDRIIGVGQAEGDIVDIFEMKLTEVVRLIRGPRGTSVRLQVRPQAGGENQILSMTRKKVELTNQEVKGEIIDTTPRLGRAGRIGVIHVPSFYHDFEGARNGTSFKNVTDDIARVLNQFSREQVDAVIIDLRDNGGGALEDAVKTSGHFIDRGPVVQVKEPGGSIQQLRDEEPGALWHGPLVVLCNRLSASASEIFAGVIKDYQRGLIIGDTTTHGKGTVQNLMELSQRRPLSFVRQNAEGTLKLTISQFYRVNGDSTQNRGVRSDIVLPSLIDHLELGEEYMENALPFDQIPPARYSETRWINPQVIAQLADQSQNRVGKSEDFAKVNKRIERFVELKNRTQLSLNEEQRRQEREADKEAQEELKKVEGEEDVPPVDAPIFPDRFYENEVLNITLDYLDKINGKVTQSR